MRKLHDLTGQRFGRLVVIERVDSLIQPSGQRKTRWLCQCDCGNTKVVQASQLKSGKTKSCGCLLSEKSRKRLIKHGKTKTRLYNIWLDIKTRCFNSNDSNFERYGAKGIKMCIEWEKDFMSFYNWSMLNGYDENAKSCNCTIDRIDNNKGYSPDNCRWVDIFVQANNKRNNHYLTYNNETHTIAEWSRLLNISRSALYNRVERHWSIEKIFTTPMRIR